jgi:hypothetical protein
MYFPEIFFSEIIKEDEMKSNQPWVDVSINPPTPRIDSFLL